MSGGQLVVLDRVGRDVKRYPLPEGLATLGSDPACDIRVMLPTVSAHHATVVVHHNQTVVRNVSTGSTLVNGAPVSVAALRHRDTIEIGGRLLRWEYTDHRAQRPLAPQPALYARSRAPPAPPAPRGRRSAGAPPAPRSPGVRLALELQHRASMPGAVGGKQVAVVQPQRRDAADRSGSSTPPRQSTSGKRSRASKNDSQEMDTSIGSESDTSKRKSSVARPSPRNTSLQGTTKASLWIESRKSSPRSGGRPRPQAPATPARRGTPLRMAVLRKAQSAAKMKVTKIEAPLTIDHTKQAAILLMTRHTPKSASPNQPSFVVKKRTPRSTPRSTPRATPRATPSPRSTSRGNNSTLLDTSAASLASPKSPPARSSSLASTSPTIVGSNSPRASPSTLLGSLRSPRSPRGGLRAAASVTSANVSAAASRGTRARGGRDTTNATLVVLSDSNMSQSTNTTRRSRSSQASSLSPLSPLPPSPKKSALKNPAAKKSTRKTESIKFDLSNLESHDDQSQDVFFVSDVTRRDDSIGSQSDVTLHYESSIKSPSPRKSIHSRSSKILERTLGTSISEPHSSNRNTLTPESPRPRKSSRVSTIVQNALESSGNSRYSQRTTKSLSDDSYDTTVASAFKTRTLSPRSPRSPSQKNLESYSIVDLVSVDSNQSGNSSVYNSMRSSNSGDTAFGTPQNSLGRKTRSTIDPTLLTSSTPYVAKTRASKRSTSNPNVSRSKNTSQASRGSSRRSKSLSTPENTQKHISVNSTRVSRASRSRSRINDSDLLLLSTVFDGETSPKSSKRPSRATKSILSLKSPLTSPKSARSSPKSARSSPKSARSSPKSARSSPKSARSSLKSARSSPKSARSSPKSAKSSTKSARSSPKSARSSLKSARSSPKSARSSPKSARSSPKSAKSSLKSARSSPKLSAKSTRKSRNTLNMPSDSSGNEGVSTPENRHSPVEVGTPVLSIQSLLNSSQSSLMSQRSTKKGRGSLKRKTIGGIPPKPKKSRASLKSKSFNFGARKTASRLSKDSDRAVEGAAASEEDIVTPKSAVKLVQEAVKNKHSTAKKPQSKRSIIDDLNYSDIVKQLFNSPVKRKLSQSMTEFSRKQLFEDDDVVVKRPTRNTVALGRTPDNTILDQSDSYTPEVFVSPLGTPSNSPNLTGIKRLFKKQTPENDLRNVRGVKALLKTPRTRRSIKNDLTRVSGVKNVFAKSPRNRLSDVRVKEVFAASPNNDLRRVSGVKSLFQTQKKGKMPKNDLRDVRGVKKLFNANSPANDLRNISGIKNVLRKNSPRNDLTDVRGVRKMFRQEKRAENADVSGIEELFNESNQSYKDSESIFDKLVGKPQVKAVYSRTFTKKSAKSRKNRPGGSLHVSIDEIIAKPEEWIQKELERRFEKKGANASRELQKLATDTVEGSAPLRTSRVRNSTLGRSAAEGAPRKRSAADSYSAHTLPIKKRSVVELSARDESSLAGRSSVSAALPIKKRAVLHSTPVKGRAPALADLGRVSPIARDNTTRSTTIIEVPVLQTTRHSTKPKAETPKAKIADEVVISPRKTRGRVTLVISPKSARKSKNESGTKKPSLVVAKKPPVMSPKPTKSETSKKTVTELVTEIMKPKSPKRARGKHVSLVVSKPSPKMKPRAVKAQEVLEDITVVPPKTRRSRKTTAPTEVDKKTESPKKSARATRNRKTTDVASKEDKVKGKAQPKTNKKADKSEEEKPSAKTRGKKADVSVKADKKQPVRATRGKQGEVAEQRVESPKRGRKTADVEKPQKKEQKTVTIVEQASPKRGRRTKDVEPKPEPPKRGKKSDAEVEKPVATRRGRNTVVVAAVQQKPVSPKRGRKIEAKVEDKPVAQRRGRNIVEQKAESPNKGRKAEDKVEQKPAQRRGRRNAQAEVESKPELPKRGRQAATSVEQKPAAQKRGQKAEVEVEKPAQTRGRKTEVAQKGGQKAQSRTDVSVSPKGRRGKVSEPVTEKRTRGRKTEPEAEVGQGGAKKERNARKRKSTAEEEVPPKVRKTRNEDVGRARGRAPARGGPPAAGVAPASRKRKTVAESPARPAKEAGKRAQRVAASPVKRAARGRPAPTETKRSTRGKR